ncbi:Ankyrin repeat [Lishizhenia tianjinensis]|uniref:Ankyrin repeat n=1 Tax=Lishizhenia tianjinensis TaxID=477690 RepID=A0A1I6XMK7_9FLAO|nr:ankyrin repeat domain-containing protein [Lishizhenia tianjinensis]SFT39669.1 Ankyrin repeat [Lishizhenia tianjinensis]
MKHCLSLIVLMVLSSFTLLGQLDRVNLYPYHVIAPKNIQGNKGAHENLNEIILHSDVWVQIDKDLQYRLAGEATFQGFSYWRRNGNFKSSIIIQPGQLKEDLSKFRFKIRLDYTVSSKYGSESKTEYMNINHGVIKKNTAMIISNTYLNKAKEALRKKGSTDFSIGNLIAEANLKFEVTEVKISLEMGQHIIDKYLQNLEEKAENKALDNSTEIENAAEPNDNTNNTRSNSFSSTPTENKSTELLDFQTRMNNYEQSSTQNLDIIYHQFSKVQPVQVDISQIRTSSSPQEALQNTENIINAYKMRVKQTNEAFYNSTFQILNNSTGTKEDLTVDLLSVGFTAAVTIGSSMEAKRELKAAELAKQKMFNQFGNELLTEYSKARFTFLDQAAFAESLKDESLAFEYAKYYLCLENELRSSFNYKDASWFNPSNRCGIPKEVSENSSITRMDMVERKLDYFDQLNYNPFKESAINLLNQEISETNSPRALIMRAKVATNNLPHRIADLYAAKELLLTDFEEDEMLLELENEFNHQYYKAIREDNVLFLMQAGIVNVLPTASSDLISMWPLSYSIALKSNQCFEYLIDQYSDVFTSKMADYYLLAAKYNALDVFKMINKSIQTDKEKLNNKAASYAFKFNSPDVFVWLLNEGVSYQIVTINNHQDEKKIAEYLLSAGLKNNDKNLMLKALSSNMLDDQKMIECYLNYGLESEEKFLLLDYISDKSMVINGRSLYQICMEVDDVDFFLKLKELDFKFVCANQIESIYATISKLSPIDICRSNLALSGFDLNTLDENGKGLIHYCIENSTLELLDLLLKRGWLDPNQMDTEGNTPLHYALHLNSGLSTLLVLCEYGANPRLTNKFGISALAYAKKEGFKSYVDVLKKR